LNHHRSQVVGSNLLDETENQETGINTSTSLIAGSKNFQTFTTHIFKQYIQGCTIPLGEIGCMAYMLSFSLNLQYPLAKLF